MSKTPTLDEIAAKGNRGHYGHKDNNDIVCVDGTAISVIAGGGTYSEPRPQFCTCAHGYPFPSVTPVESTLGHDYAGPYTHVEVYTDDPELFTLADVPFEGEVDAFTLSVEEVRSYILKHGGEWHADDADDFLFELTQEKK